MTELTLSLQTSLKVDSRVEDIKDEESAELAVMPFSNSVFDKHLECIHVTADESLPARLGVMKLYRETHHWYAAYLIHPKYCVARSFGSLSTKCSFEI
jgi:hypothetical protein